VPSDDAILNVDGIGQAFRGAWISLSQGPAAFRESFRFSLEFDANGPDQVRRPFDPDMIRTGKDAPQFQGRGFRLP
jgi:hypothetical protein